MCCKDLAKLLNADENCFEEKSSAKENNPEFRIVPKRKGDKFCRITVDNCLIKDSTLKCDYVFVKCSSKELIFVELKSQSEIVHGIKQLSASAKYFRESLKTEVEINDFGLHKPHSAHIVTKSQPPASKFKVQEMIAKFTKINNFKLRVHSNNNGEISI